ncbi:DUF551 domain-containing protein [Pantoea agglomerans]|uniref:DUF551 domain-containing protein n=1 Tax=Enterobacter agglomerans TaxID=549 RepID=UPI003DA1A28B
MCDWIKCSENMPESGTSVLVWDEEVLVGESADCTTHYDLGIFWVHDKHEGFCVKSYASHWQPLPSPPEDV